MGGAIFLTLRGFRFHNQTSDSLREIRGSLTLVREPKNPYDPNAIAVYHKEEKIGYIAKEQAIILAQILDEQNPLLICNFYRIEETHAILEWEIPESVFFQIEMKLGESKCLI